MLESNRSAVRYERLKKKEKKQIRNKRNKRNYVVLTRHCFEVFMLVKGTREMDVAY